MSRPIIKKISPFDGTEGGNIYIAWTGNRAYANRVIIYDNETNNIVYDRKITTYELKHTIPAGKLSNGKSWVIQAQVFDEEDIPSALSEKYSFYTFKRPTFIFNDLPEDHKITSTSFIATIHYFSEDWENISKYVFYLYDSSKIKIVESSEMTDDANISYTYRGLENNALYYIRCTGITVNGMELDTGYIEINVKYKNPNTYATIYTTPLPSQGCIQVSSNLVMIQYNGTNDFTYKDGKINLINKTLYYDEGFLIENDYTLILRGTNLWQTAEILRMKNKDLGLTLSSRIYTDDTLRFRLSAPNGICNYLLYSNALEFTNNDMVTIAIRCKNNVYQLDVFVNGVKT